MDVVRDELALRLVDRLDDIRREEGFPLALDLGSGAGYLHRALFFNQEKDDNRIFLRGFGLFLLFCNPWFRFCNGCGPSSGIIILVINNHHRPMRQLPSSPFTRMVVWRVASVNEIPKSFLKSCNNWLNNSQFLVWYSPFQMRWWWCLGHRWKRTTAHLIQDITQVLQNLPSLRHSAWKHIWIALSKGFTCYLDCKCYNWPGHSCHLRLEGISDTNHNPRPFETRSKQCDSWSYRQRTCMQWL